MENTDADVPLYDTRILNAEKDDVDDVENTGGKLCFLLLAWMSEVRT
jgi:hypothetical protein